MKASNQPKATCVKCGSEKPIRGRSVLPDGWVFSDPDADGKVEPVCDKCQGEPEHDEDG